MPAPRMSPDCDLAIAGGGIQRNGHRARRRGRELKGLLHGRDGDLASHTSSGSTKLGPRRAALPSGYCEFRLVAEALAERVRSSCAPRRTSLRAAAVRPAARAAHLRPAWMIRRRAISSTIISRRRGRRCQLRRSAFTLGRSRVSAGLAARCDKGFESTRMQKKSTMRGLVCGQRVGRKTASAEIRTRTRPVGARRDRGPLARTLFSPGGGSNRAEIRRLGTYVNAAGPMGQAGA